MNRNFHYSMLAAAVMVAIMFPVAAQDLLPIKDGGKSAADDGRVFFDPIFLNASGSESVDLKRFERGDSASPGIWPTDIYVNNELVSHESVLFSEVSDKSVQPCLSPAVLKKINFNYSELPASFNQSLARDKECYLLPELIPQASIAFDSGSQRLDISIPQAMMQNTARGYVSPELWDSGVPALMFGYNASTYTTRSRGQDYNSAYAGINTGLNLGAWYFRHDGSYNWQENGGSRYQSLNNYVQRDIPAIKGRVRMGETSTRGQLFDTLPFKGIELVSDDRMLPQSQRGYAPDIRGIARTTARVTVYQNSRIIYETTVSPGAFVIDDLYPTGYGGNLEVTVTEADGSVQTFSVPYSSVTQLLRPGMHRYDIVAGRLNDPSLSFNPSLYQATYQRGLNNALTGFAGIQGSSADYYALQGGVAVSTEVGAFSASITQARTHLEKGTVASSGQSYQVSYSKFIPDTDSNLTLAAYRFSTSGYYDFTTAMRAIDAEKHGGSADSVWRPKNRFNITMNQGLADGWGQMYLTGYTQDYWNNGGSDLQYQLGYSNNWRDISYSVSAGRVRNYGGDMETTWLFNMTMPLGSRMNNAPTLTASLSHNSNGRTGERVGISGSAGDDNQYNYGMSAMNYNQGTGSSMAVNGGWRSPYTHLTAMYGAGEHYQNASVGMSGTVIAWQNGIVATPYTGDTFAVVEAEGAKGAKVGGYSGVRIDPWGHAAVPYLNPYEINEITIDPKGLPYDVELENTTDKVAPHSGAVSRIVFKTSRGTPLLIMTKMTSGEVVPFGAEVYDSAGVIAGSVGQSGQMYVRVEDKHGRLTVKWGEAPEQVCHVEYSIPEEKKSAAQQTLVRLNSVCH
ncbi:fimbria/pilus outer membrane usher protein [Enterobacter bugandensis]|uniref:fimbria/pilus outer membrane usher protein n=1 Tax=Enterobacter bugandensis TaxID=881260 RepID=UPI0032AECBEB